MSDYISEADCLASRKHLTDVDADGYCNFCGSRRPVPTEEDWIELHTTAPVDYDGFGTETIAVVGHDKRGREVRHIRVKKQHHTWQTMRYGSGLRAYTNERMTFKDFVSLGDWQLC